VGGLFRRRGCPEGWGGPEGYLLEKRASRVGGCTREEDEEEKSPSGEKFISRVDARDVCDANHGQDEGGGLFKQCCRKRRRRSEEEGRDCFEREKIKSRVARDESLPRRWCHSQTESYEEGVD